LEGSLSDAFQASHSGGYCTLEEVRAVIGADDPPSDADIVESIRMYSQFIDRTTRQWFEPRTLDVKLDGVRSEILHLGVPIIGLDALYVNGDLDSPLDTESYVVYNNLGRGLKDDRRNPKIAMSNLGSADLYRRLASAGTFVEGNQNQRLVGTFGFVEPDGSAPELIKRACLKMVVAQLEAEGLSPEPLPAGPIIGETTDGHTIRYGSTVSGRRAGTFGITNDPEVEAILLQYRAPKGITLVS
jgi:hypothetical protein